MKSNPEASLCVLRAVQRMRKKKKKKGKKRHSRYPGGGLVAKVVSLLKM